MTVLHLGVIDLPYVQEGASNSAQTTGDVAEILEAKYHVMEIFAEVHEEDIAKAMVESVLGAMETAAMGGVVLDPYAEGADSVTSMFKEFLSSKEMDDTGTPGVPTQAALRGVNHRLKIKKGAPRPSFIDTGLYQSSAKAWADEDYELTSTLFRNFGAGFGGEFYAGSS